MSKSTTSNGTSRQGGEKRGNSADRKRSRENLVRFWGDGATVDCVYCGATLRNMSNDEVKAYNAANGRPFGTTPPMHVTRDRIDPNGSYTMQNLVPACFTCNNAATDTPWADRFDDPATAEALELRAASYTPRPRK